MLTHRCSMGQKNDTPPPTSLIPKSERGRPHARIAPRIPPLYPPITSGITPRETVLTLADTARRISTPRDLNRRAAEAAEIRGRFWGGAQCADRCVGHDTCEPWSWMNSQKVAERETPKDFAFRGAATLSGARWALCGLCRSAVKSQGAAEGLEPLSLARFPRPNPFLGQPGRAAEGWDGVGEGA